VTALVLFPDTDLLARKVVLQGLSEHGITGIAVGTKMPSPMQNRFILCYTIPGRATRRTQSVQVVALVYDTKGNEQRCKDLAIKVAAVLRSAPEMEIDGKQFISEPCELHGPYYEEDPDLPGIPRQRAAVTWTVQSTVTP
jgi:hypothetical protein